MDVYASSGLLCDLSYCRTLPSDYSANLGKTEDHSLTRTPSRSLPGQSPALGLTISLCTRMRRGKSVWRPCPGRPPKGAPPGPRGPRRGLFSIASSTFSCRPSSSTPFSWFTALQKRTREEVLRSCHFRFSYTNTINPIIIHRNYFDDFF